MSPPATISAARSQWASTKARLGEAGRFFVPLDWRVGMSYWLDSLFVAHGLRERLLRAVSSDLLGGRQGTWLIDASCTAPPGRRWQPIQGIVAALEAGDGELLRDTPLEGQGPLRWIVRADYPRQEGQRWVLYLFADPEPHPQAVIKLKNRAVPGPTLRREMETLRLVRTQVSAALQPTLPEPLTYRLFENLEALVISSLPGRSAYTEMQNALRPARRLACHFEVAASWLARFHLDTRGSDDFYRVELDRPLVVAEAAAAIGSEAHLEPSWYRWLGERLASRPLPLSRAHGDFWAGNLLVDSTDKSRGATLATATGVVDWEASSGPAPPFEDLFSFPVTYGLNYPWKRYRRASPEEAFRRTFLHRNIVSRSVRRYLRSYCAAAGLEASLLRPLFCLYLLKMAARSSGPSVEPALWRRFYSLLMTAGETTAGEEVFGA